MRFRIAQVLCGQILCLGRILNWSPLNDSATPLPHGRRHRCTTSGEGVFCMSRLSLIPIVALLAAMVPSIVHARSVNRHCSRRP